MEAENGALDILAHYLALCPEAFNFFFIISVQTDRKMDVINPRYSSVSSKLFLAVGIKVIL
jgi:hypothetical protein